MSASRELDTYHQERHASVEAFNRSRLGLGDPEAKANALKRRFRSISRSYERSRAGRRILAKTARVAGIALLFVAPLTAPIAVVAPRLGWPFTIPARHFLAWPNCGVAREMGLAPTFRGGPGYWRHHDADKDCV